MFERSREEKRKPLYRLKSSARSDREKYLDEYSSPPSKEEIDAAYKSEGLQPEEYLDFRDLLLKNPHISGKVGAWARIMAKEHDSFGSPTYSKDEYEEVDQEKDVSRRDKLEERITDEIRSTNPDEVLRGVVSLAALIGAGRADWSAASRVLEDSTSFDKNQSSSWGRVYNAVFEAAKLKVNPKTFQGLRDIANIIEQNPQMIHPKQMFDIAQEQYFDTRIPGFLRGGLVHSLGYALRFFGQSKYEKEITKHLDFENKERFGDTARFLELVSALYNIGDEYSYQGDDTTVVRRVRSALEDAVRKQKGSYLLNLRARFLLEQMDGRIHVDSGRDRRPFRFQGVRYAWHFEDGIHVSSLAITEQVSDLVEKLDALEKEIIPPQHLIDEAIARGENEVMWEPDRKLMRRRQDIYKELTSLFSKKLEAEDIVSSPSVSDDDFRDYEYLLSRPTRETIEKEFGVSIADLTPHEQFAFLSFIKTEDAMGVQEVQRFVRAYGRDGVRAFLVMEHDKDFAHVLVWTGNLFLEGGMTDGDPFFKEILQSYGRVLDGVDKVRDVYRERLGKEMTAEEYERVGAVLRENATRILKKSVQGILGDTKKKEDGTEEVRADQIRKDLQQIEVEMIVTTCMIRAFGLDPTSLKGSGLFEIPGSRLKGMLREQMEMLEIQEKRYRGRDGYSDELVDTLNEGLSSAMSHPDSRFFVYTLPFTSGDAQPRIGGFFRLDTRIDEKGEKYLHLASVMLDPALEGGKIVENILAKVLRKEGGTMKIIAECDPRSGITQKYIEWGFVATSADVALGLPILNIEWNTERNNALQTNAAVIPSQQTIVTRQGAISPSDTVRYAAFSAPPDFSKLLVNGYVLTRYFSKTIKGEVRYFCVFEKDPLNS